MRIGKIITFSFLLLITGCNKKSDGLVWVDGISSYYIKVRLCDNNNTPISDAKARFATDDSLPIEYINSFFKNAPLIDTNGHIEDTVAGQQWGGGFLPGQPLNPPIPENPGKIWLLLQRDGETQKYEITIEEKAITKAEPSNLWIDLGTVNIDALMQQ